MTFGLYIPRRSPIHALSAQVKLLGLVGIGALVFAISDVRSLGALLAIVSGLIALAKLPFQTIWQQFRPIFLLLLAILLINGLFSSWETGWIAVLRFAILISTATIVTLTTQVSEMVEAIEQGLHPLQQLGINPAKVGFLLALSIRLVPVLLEQFHQIQEAQQARGLDRHFIALLVPLLVKVLRMADELSDALDARCYDAD